MKINILFVVLFIVSLQLCLGQPTPAEKQAQPILLLNGVAHLGTGKVIKNSAITFEEGIIKTVADASVSNFDLENFKVIELDGAHVYPGLIAPNTNLGLIEVEAVRATDDTREVGIFNPNVRSIIAYNADSEISPTVRSNGILMAQVVPSGGRIMGTSSIVQLDAWNYEDAIVKEDDGVWMNWPARWRYKGFWEGGGTAENKKYEKQITSLTQFMDEAQAYCKGGTPKTTNLKFKAMCSCFDKSSNTYIKANNVKDIIAVLDFATTYNLKLVLVGGNDAHMITDLLVKNKISLILNPVNRLPSKQDDAIDLPFKLPSILAKAGLLFTFTTPNFSGDVRNLTFHAGNAVAYGLDAEIAIQAMTLNAAKIFGIDEKVGSLEAGKAATLFVSSGDILDVKTHNVTHAFINGRQIDLSNKQSKLSDKFMKKYGLE